MSETAPPSQPTEAEWDLDALCAEGARLLASTGAAAADARVREVPDGRTVRYYQTIGLLDRPLRYDGRKAIYGRRHLLQLVAAKLLQARGLSLAQVQNALAAATSAQLEAAVREAVSAAPAVPTMPPTPAPATAWRTVELAPGLLVTVDPRRHPDCDALLNRLRLALGAYPPPTP